MQLPAPATQQVPQDGVALSRNLAGLVEAVGQLAAVQRCRRQHFGHGGSAGCRRRRQRRRASRRLCPPAPPHSLVTAASDTALLLGRALGGPAAAWRSHALLHVPQAVVGLQVPLQSGADGLMAQQRSPAGMAATHSCLLRRAPCWKWVSVLNSLGAIATSIGSGLEFTVQAPSPCLHCNMATVAAAAPCSVVAPCSKRIAAVSARSQQLRPQRPASGTLAASSKVQRASRASLVRVAAMAASTATQKSVSGTMAALKAEGK